MSPSKTRKYILLTHPRTASNLLIKILSLQNQPTLVTSDKRDYFFLPSLGLNLETVGKPLTEWSTEQKQALKESNQKCFDALRQHVATAEAEGKNVFVKEHLAWMVEPLSRERFTLGKGGGKQEDHDQDDGSWRVKVHPNQTYSPLNETVLPDEELNTWFPTFLIRHPALVFPSLYRTCVDLEGLEEARSQAKGPHLLEMTLHWSRTLYDWYKHQRENEERNEDAAWPIVLDADDILLSPSLVYKYCDILGLDSTRLSFSWNVASQEELDKLDPVERRMLSTISTSTGVRHDKVAGEKLDIQEEFGKWRDEFGLEDAVKLKGWVDGAMGDYKYLRERRLRV